RTVDGDERGPGASGQVVKRLGHEVLARAAFPGDQDRSRRGCDLLDQVVEPPHGQRTADEPAVVTERRELAFEPSHLAAHLVALGDPVYQHAQAFEIYRLGEKVERPL